ncbi:MAG: class II fructose-bisphosphate aldolase [Deltaproteobacteria bacterium]|nr:class II fructose-bisphosphate aldolase [Deltaproteobacteria bacterium]
MPVSNLNDVLRKAMNQDYAVGAFNIHNLEFAKAVMQAAEELESPVILGIAPVSIDYAGLDELAAVARVCAERSNVPTVIHLDHGRDIEAVKKSISLGFSSVMYDGSKYPMEENIKRTREVVQVAHDSGVPVEGEIGIVGGYEELSGGTVDMDQLEKLYTVAEDAIRFVKETGVDALAVAVGTVHCMPIQKAQIDFKRLQEIHQAVDIPLVFHGCTGLKNEDYQKASELGVKKFNIGTRLMMEFQAKLYRELQNAEHRAVLRCLKEATEAVYRAVKDRMLILNCAGKV